jgi:hypothetical protein
MARAAAGPVRPVRLIQVSAVSAVRAESESNIGMELDRPFTMLVVAQDAAQERARAHLEEPEEEAPEAIQVSVPRLERLTRVVVVVVQVTDIQAEMAAPVL